MQEEKTTRILPPGIENVSNEQTGFLSLSVGNVLWFTPKVSLDHIRFRPLFWGETDSNVLLRASNTSDDVHTTTQRKVVYEVRCDMSKFRKYLFDTGSVKVNLVDVRNGKSVGYVQVPLHMYLSTAMYDDTTVPLRKITSSFPILKMPLAHHIESYPDKIGEVEIDIRCTLHAPQSDTVRRVQSGGVKGESFKNKLAEARKVERETKQRVEREKEVVRDGGGEAQDPFDEVIERAEGLKKRLVVSEQNKNIDIEKRMRKQLYDGAGNEPFFDYQVDEYRPKYKESELERLRLVLEDPQMKEILREDTSKKDKKKKEKLELSDIENIKTKLLRFIPTHPVLADRLIEKAVILQLQVPKFNDKQSQDSYQ